VPCTTWDAYAGEKHLVGRVTMMKLDVEGWESRVLLGACHTLARHDSPVLQIEFTDEASVAAGLSCQDLYRQLEELGYEMFTYDGLRQTIVKAPLRTSYPWINLIATKNPAEIMVRLSSKKTT
jgi:hypothetical protein